MEAETQTPSAHIGQLTSEFMEYLEREIPTEVPIAALVAVWTESGVYWRVDAPDEADEGGNKATARLAVSLADAALDDSVASEAEGDG